MKVGSRLENKSQFAEKAPAAPAGNPQNFWQQKGLLVLALLAGMMQACYLWMHRLNNLKEHVETFLPLALLLGILYFVSIYAAEKISPRRPHLMFLFLMAAAFRLTLFPLYPSLADDLYRYRWEGKVQQAGYNPYLVRPSDPDLVSLRDETYPAVSGPDFTTVYGPLMEELYWLAYAVTDGVIPLKLPYLLLDLGVVLLLLRWLPLLGLSPLRALVYAWSPLAVVEFGANAHNDALPLFTFMLALFWFQKGRQKSSLAALAASVLSKLYAGFLLPVFLLRTSWKLLWVPAAVAVAAFAPYAGGWTHLRDAISGYTKNWRNNESLYAILDYFAADTSQAWNVYFGIVAAVILYCLVRKLPPERASFLILGTVLLFSANAFPWYVTWILPLLAVYPNPAWLLWSVTVLLFYHVVIPYGTLGLWQENDLFRLLQYVPFYALLLGGFLAERFRRARRPSASASASTL